MTYSVPTEDLPGFMLSPIVFLLAPEKFRTFSYFCTFYNNNDSNFPYISIKNCPEDVQNFRPSVKKDKQGPVAWREQKPSL